MDKDKERSEITILDFSPERARFFERLNREWIERYFEMEPPDYLMLQNPETQIIEKGGAVLFAATADGEIVGTLALIPAGEDCLELAKMAVAETAQGRGIGGLLGEAAVTRAREMGAKRVILYTNTLLQPAIRLYRRLGFQEIPVEKNYYNRADFKMAMNFDDGQKEYDK